MGEELKLSGKTVPCPVCSKNTALEEGAGGITSWLCVNCGYTSNTMFEENNADFQTTPKAIMNLKKWDALRSLYWIPTVINMPTRGLIFPEKHGKQIIWTYVPMVDIPIEEQKDYPIAGQDGEFYKKKLDADKAEKHSNFYDALKAMGAIVELDDLQENVIEEKKDAQAKA